MNPLHPRPVHDGDPLAGFDCGNEVMNRWLVQRALRNQRSGDSRTFVTVDHDSGEVLGFYSLASWTVSHEDAGGGWMRRNAPDPILVILLGRLAVSTKAHGLGLGHDLLADALANATVAARYVGARALVAEAIDENAQAFYAHEGLWQSPSRPDLFCARLVLSSEPEPL